MTKWRAKAAPLVKSLSGSPRPPEGLSSMVPSIPSYWSNEKAEPEGGALEAYSPASTEDEKTIPEGADSTDKR